MKNYLSLIKFSHTIFAMPFALVGFFLGTAEVGQFEPKLLIFVILCMLFARSAAMAFNRYLDREIDAANPRTKIREIPAGIIKPQSALIFIIANSLLFVATTYFINFLCFILSPVALLVVLGYSYTKRFTALCHFVLGLGLSLAPIGAYLAVTGEFAWLPVIYSVTVLLWVSGFDIIYALQDVDFDKSLQLNSVPVRLGRKGALQLAILLHCLCAILMITANYMLLQINPAFGLFVILACSVFICMLFYQHTLVKPNDLSRVNLAFFTTNGVASVIYGTLFLIDLFF